MAMTALRQFAFTGGEWDPVLHARTDLARYFTAAREIRNMIVRPHGGCIKRGGLEFVDEVSDSTKFHRLISFQFSTVQNYVLVFGDEKVRVIRNGGVVVLPSTPTAWNSGTAYVQGNHCSKSGVNYYAKQAGTNKDPATETAYWYPLTSDIVEIPTPYDHEDLPLLRFCQTADVMYLTHPDYPLQKLTRTDHHVWTISPVTFGTSIAAPANITRSAGTGTTNSLVVTAVNERGEESVASSAQAAGVTDTISWDAVTGAAYYCVYKQRGIYGYIGMTTGTTFTDATLEPNLSISPPAAKTPFGAATKYPGSCTLFEQRLLLARTDEKPNTVFGSQTGAYENFNFSTPIQDDDAYEFTINANQVNEIVWLIPLNELLIGTSGGEWKLTGGDAGVSPTNVSVRIQSWYGCGNLHPLVVGRSALFVTRSMRQIRDLSYSIDVDGYNGTDLSIFAQHLFQGRTVADWCYQQNPDSIVWVVMSDGTLLGMTYVREQEVVGWHRQETDGYFESCASLVTADGTDEVYFIVQRTIDGTTRRYIERLADILPVGGDVEDSFYVDSGLTYDGWNATATHLMALTGGTTWAAGESLTLTASGAGHAPFATPASIGRTYRLRSGTDEVDVEVTAFTSATVVTVTSAKNIPTALRTTATADFALTVTAPSGLGHLEGKTVVALCDGNVVRGQVVTSGAIELEHPIAKAHVGLPFTARLETLDLEPQGQGMSMRDRHRQPVSSTVRFWASREAWVGTDDSDAAYNLVEMRFRKNEDYGKPIALFDGEKDINLPPPPGGRSSRLIVASYDPVPLGVLAVLPKVTYGET